MSERTAPSRFEGDSGATDGFLRGDQGWVLAFTALMILPIMAFTGFAVDLGAWYARAAQIQRATDSAALAGARYMPNYLQGRDAAIETATRNGFTNGVNGNTVSVTGIPGQSTRLRVSIDDTGVDQFFSTLFRSNVSIARDSVGEIVQPIPMGSPKNFLGTGNSNPNGPHRENFQLAVQGYCSRNEHGDRITPRVDANGGSSGMTSTGDTAWQSNFANCTPGAASNPSGNVVENPYYSADGYFFGVQSPVPTASNWTLQVYDAPHCIVHYPSGQDSGADEFGAVNNPSGPNTPAWTAGVTYANNNAVRRNGRIYVSKQNGNLNRTPPIGAADSWWDLIALRQYDFIVRSNDRPDNPSLATVLYQKRFDPTTDCQTYRSSWQNLYTFPAGSFSTATTYFVQVKPVIPAETNLQEGNNQFGLRLTRNGTFTPCSTSSNQTGYNIDCLNLYAVSHLPVYVTISSAQASFFLASIGPEYNNHTMEVELFDSAEGANSIELLNPLGNPVTFTWEVACKDGSYQSESGSCTTGENAPNGGYGPATANIKDVSGVVTPSQRPWGQRNGQAGKYSDRSLRLKYVLPANMATAYGGQTWWKIRYTASSSIGDRTTWSVSVMGDPVRLVPQ